MPKNVDRVAILIGVDKTGGLPRLNDAARGVGRMEDWARTQRFNTIEKFTDEGGRRVYVREIKQAIKNILDQGGADQLVVYFAGHGINIQYNEYWLLSDAPDDPQEAVNLEGSVVLARYSGIPHVVFISDACRTAAQGVKFQGIRGSEIFPNDPVGDLEHPIDQYFACALGRPAHEIKDPKLAAKEYSGLFTEALRGALSGDQPQLYEWSDDGSEDGLLRPRRLKAHLLTEVTEKLKRLNLNTRVNQTPDARITSDETVAWISRLRSDQLPSGGRLPAFGTPPSEPPPTAAEFAGALMDLALEGAALDIGSLINIKGYVGDDLPGGIDIFKANERAAAPVDEKHFEGNCALEVRGARIVEASASDEHGQRLKRSDQVVSLSLELWTHANVLLELEGDRSLLIPALPDFVGTLTIDDGELVEVSYEPLPGSRHAAGYGPRAEKIRRLRTIAAASTAAGVFRLEGESAEKLAEQMQYSKGFDPALAIYAAYAFDDQRRRARLREMSDYLAADLGAPLFDVALLAGRLTAKGIAPLERVISPFPLLSQGWALLSAYRVMLPESLRPLVDRLVPSVWTLFDGQAVPLIRNAFRRGDLR